MKVSSSQELSLHGTDSVRLTSTPQPSTRRISQKPLNSDQSQGSQQLQHRQQEELFPVLTSQNSTSLLSDFLAKICLLLENEKDLTVSEVGYSLKQLGSLTKQDPVILSLRTSKVFSVVPEGGTLSEFCEQSPTLGMMVNGNCLILPGFCPKIESGYTLSDILQPTEQVDPKYFLSERAVSVLLKYNERQERGGAGFRAEFTKGNEIKKALKVGGMGVNDLVDVSQTDRQ